MVVAFLPLFLLMQDISSLISEGKAFWANNEIEKAALAFRGALDQSPESPSALMWLGMLNQQRAGDDRNSLETDVLPLYDKARRILSNQANAVADMALALELNAEILAKLGRDAEARQLSVEAGRLHRQSILDLLKQMPAGEGGGVYRIGGTVNPPRIIKRIEPAYPDEARLHRVAGDVVVSIIVDTKGVPRNIHITRGLGFGLDEAAVAAVMQWRFAPAIKGGDPVNVGLQVSLAFKL
ncbi:MAG TPA: energy transducer TonB [Bryobacteraceae bacterium]|nr:energy transducer TonB [Bryobacteraceae bacterium]